MSLSTSTWLKIDEERSETRSDALLDRFLSPLGSRSKADRIWREPPVDIATFASEFLDRRTLSDFNRDALWAFAGDRGDDWSEQFKVVSLVWGMRSGKNFIAEIMVLYTMYRLLLLVSPGLFFGFGNRLASYIDILNVSFVNETQAKQIFFDRMKLAMRATIDPDTGRNWFEQRGVDLRDNGIGDIKEKIILLPRNIRARCLPFTEVGFEGSDILLAIIDEPSRAVQSPPDNIRAHKLFHKMRDNTTGTYGSKGKLVLFSYPESQDGDLIMECFARSGTQFTTNGRRVRESGDDVDPTMYGSLGATYEVRQSVKIEHFEHERRADPEGFQTRIQCQPPHSHTGFYRAYPDKVRASFNVPERGKAFEYRIVPVTHEVQVDGRLVTRTYTGVELEWANGDDEYRALGGDPGESSDIFALALARAEPIERAVECMVIRRERERQSVPHGFGGEQPEIEVDRERNLVRARVDRLVVVDGLCEIVPIRYTRRDDKTGREVSDTHPISFVSVCDFVLQLKGHFPNLQLAGFDRWNSPQLIEELLRRGKILAESFTFSAQQQFELYSEHRSLVYNDVFRCLPSPTKTKDGRLRAEAEFVDLQEVIPGRKVDHKPEGSKDTADSVVIATHLVLQLSMGVGANRIIV